MEADAEARLSELKVVSLVARRLGPGRRWTVMAESEDGSGGGAGETFAEALEGALVQLQRAGHQDVQP